MCLSFLTHIVAPFCLPHYVRHGMFWLGKQGSLNGERLAGRERDDGVECWVAVTTEAFSQALLSEKPLTKDGAYVPQTHVYLTDTAGRIWAAVRDTLKPFISKQFRCFLLVLRICLN